MPSAAELKARMEQEAKEAAERTAALAAQLAAAEEAERLEAECLEQERLEREREERERRERAEAVAQQLVRAAAEEKKKWEDADRQRKEKQAERLRKERDETLAKAQAVIEKQQRQRAEREKLKKAAAKAAQKTAAAVTVANPQASSSKRRLEDFVSDGESEYRPGESDGEDEGESSVPEGPRVGRSYKRGGRNPCEKCSKQGIPCKEYKGEKNTKACAPCFEQKRKCVPIKGNEEGGMGGNKDIRLLAKSINGLRGDIRDLSAGIEDLCKATGRLRKETSDVADYLDASLKTVNDFNAEMMAFRKEVARVRTLTLRKALEVKGKGKEKEVEEVEMGQEEGMAEREGEEEDEVEKEMDVDGPDGAASGTAP